MYRSRALADVAIHIYHEDLIGHIDLPLMHIVQHSFGVVRPDFIIAGMVKKSDADNNVAFESEALLRREENLINRLYVK